MWYGGILLHLREHIPYDLSAMLRIRLFGDINQLRPGEIMVQVVPDTTQHTEAEAEAERWAMGDGRAHAR